MLLPSKIFGLYFSQATRSELAEKVAGEPVAKGAGPRSIHTANLDHVVQLRRNPRLRQAYDNAWAITADGMPVFLYAKARGAAVRTRVTGADLFGDILALLRPGMHRCFFVASSAKTGCCLVAWLTRRGFPRSSIDFVVPPRGFENDATYSDDLATKIRAHRTTHLFLGVGAPKSEIWVHEYRDALGDCYALSAGAGLDFFVGTAHRAPHVLQEVGLEWLWRFCREPRRLFRRYFIDSWLFIAAVAEDLADESVPQRRVATRLAPHTGRLAHTHEDPPT